MKEYVQKVTSFLDLTRDEAEDAITKIFTDATDVEITAMLVGMAMKGEVPDEIAGFAAGMRNAANRISPKTESTLVDTCGTGGDSKNTINISTAAAIVAAGAGVPIAKHGNIAITSRSGSADVLRELGVGVDCEPKKVEQTIEDVGIGFMLAPVFHPAMKRVGPIRRELGIRTIFNILGPLTNPASAKAQVIGVFDEALCEPMANVLNMLGLLRAFVVHGSGMDEVSTIDATFVAELKNGRVDTYHVRPEDFGMNRAKFHDIAGGSPHENAKCIVDILIQNNANDPKHAKRDIVVLNAAFAIVAGGLATDIEGGIRMAEDAIDSGKALDKLKAFVAATGDIEKLNRFL